MAASASTAGVSFSSNRVPKQSTADGVKNVKISPSYPTNFCLASKY